MRIFLIFFVKTIVGTMYQQQNSLNVHSVEHIYETCIVGCTFGVHRSKEKQNERVKSEKNW